MIKVYSALWGRCLPILLLICMSGFASTERLIQIHYQEVDLAVKKTFIYEDLTLQLFENETLIKSSKIRLNDDMKIRSSLSSLNPVLLHQLSIPSKKYRYDGAAMARLKLVYMTDSFTSPIFDADNPPSELRYLIPKIKTLIQVN